MTFATPAWLLVGLVLVAAAWLGLRASDGRRRRDLEDFATRSVLDDLTASLSPARRRAKRAILLSAAALGFLALAGPERGFDWERTERRGIDVLVAVDVSRSMLAQDVRPDRLRRAKLAVDDLMRRLGGDRLGLIAFAGTAFLQCPLTLDHAAFQRSLEALDAGIISAPGSNLAAALDAARKALASEAKNVKLLVLFSDGEDLGGGAIAAAERAAADGIRVFTVGVGTPAGELIPIAGDDGTGGFVKDAAGHIVKSRLDEATLRRVAEITDGFYVPLGARAEGVEEIAERALAPVPREELASRLRRVPRNRYAWPLAGALFLLVLEPFLGERSAAPRRSGAADRDRSPAALALALATASIFAGAGTAHAASSGEAARLYDERSYEAAAEQFRTLRENDDDPRLDVNLGTASYRAGDFEEAAQAFARALRSDDDALRERAFYDLGNAQYRLGEGRVTTDPEGAAGAWEQAVAAYEEAIGLDERDEDARFNRDFVKRKLEELRRQMEQSQQESRQSQPPEEPPPEPEPEPEPQDGSQGQPSQNGGESAPSPSEGAADRPPGEAPPERDERSSPPEEEPPHGPNGDTGTTSAPPEPTPPGADRAASARSTPGTLSEREARELLDSLRDDEAVMPVAPLGPTTPPAADDLRDW